MNKFLLIMLLFFLIGIVSASHISEQQVQGFLSSGELPNQEVAAYYPLIADFGEGSNNEFSYLDAIEDVNVVCEKIQSPENLIIYKSSSGKCKIRWDNDAPYLGTENPKNSEQGIHEIKINVRNSLGKTADYSFNITVYTWIINLEEGWNLISIPYVPKNKTLQSKDLGLWDNLESIESIWSYEYNVNTNSSMWKHYSNSSSDDLYFIEPGRGYWIKANKKMSIKGFGTKTGQSNSFPGMPPEIQVRTNSWSLIGRYGIIGKNGIYSGETCLDAGGLTKEIAMDSVTKRNNELTLYNEEFEIVNSLYNNEGYWLWIENNFGNSAYESYAPLDNYYSEEIWC